MQVNGLGPINRIPIDGLEPRPPVRPAVPPPARSDGFSQTATPAGPNAAAAETGPPPRPRVALELEAAFRDLRSSLSESSLAGGGQFRAPATSITSDVLATPPSDSGSASVNAPARPENLERFPTLVDDRQDQATARPDPAAEGAAQESDAEAQRPARDGARNLGDATLASLGSSINLQSAAGRFQIDVNGQTLNFRADQTLNDVLSGISGPNTGARASLDQRGRIQIESTTGGELSIRDREGNLSSGLGIEVTPAGSTNEALSRQLQDFATGVNRALQALERRAGPPAIEQETDAVLRELESALNGIFNASPGQDLQGLGDLGFSRAGGSVQVDTARLQSLVENRPDEVNRVVSSLFDENSQVLVGSGEQAAREVGEFNPDARQNVQNVRLRIEAARLQVRQQTLTLDRTAVENIRERLARQTESLTVLAEQLAERLPSGLSREAEKALAFANSVQADRPTSRPIGSTRIPVPEVLGRPYV